MLQLDADDTVFLGDTHMDAPWTESAIRHAAEQLGAKSIVQLGDFGFTFDLPFVRRVQGALEKYGARLYFVRGNHDSTDVLRDLDASDSLAVAGDPFAEPRALTDLEDCRIFHLPDGMRFRLGDETVLAMGGAGSIDRGMRVPGYSWWEDERTDPEVARAAADAGRADILIAHDVPSGVGFPMDPRFGHYFETRDTGVLRWCDESAEVLDALAEAVQPRLIVHGHHHRRLDLARRSEGRTALSVGLSRDGRPFRDAMIHFSRIAPED